MRSNQHAKGQQQKQDFTALSEVLFSAHKPLTAEYQVGILNVIRSFVTNTCVVRE